AHHSAITSIDKGIRLVPLDRLRPLINTRRSRRVTSRITRSTDHIVVGDEGRKLFDRRLRKAHLEQVRAQINVPLEDNWNGLNRLKVCAVVSLRIHDVFRRNSFSSKLLDRVDATQLKVSVIRVVTQNLALVVLRALRKLKN